MVGLKLSGSHQFSHYVGLQQVIGYEYFVMLAFFSIIWVCLVFLILSCSVGSGYCSLLYFT